MLQFSSKDLQYTKRVCGIDVSNIYLHHGKNVIVDDFRIEEGQDITPKIREFKQQLESARFQVHALTGIDHSVEEQKNIEHQIRKQIELKTELLEKYRRLCDFQKE